MRELSLEEYHTWLENNRNKEEAMAEKVVDEILKEHVESRWIATDYEPYFIPRKIINIDGRRLEFDLLIHLKDTTTRERDISFDRLIAVEFKETDLKKVVRQAMVRRWYVDYMYVATKPIPATPEELILLSYMRIGWVVWNKSKNVAFIVLRSFYRDSDRLNNIVFTLVESRLAEVINYTADKVFSQQTKTKSLLDFLEVEENAVASEQD